MSEFKHMWTAEELQNAVLPGLTITAGDYEGTDGVYFNDENGDPVLFLTKTANGESNGLVVLGNYFAVTNLNGNNIFRVVTDEGYADVANPSGEHTYIHGSGMIENSEDGVKVFAETKTFEGNIVLENDTVVGTFTLRYTPNYNSGGTEVGGQGTLAMNFTTSTANTNHIYLSAQNIPEFVGVIQNKGMGEYGIGYSAVIAGKENAVELHAPSYTSDFDETMEGSASIIIN